MGIGNGIAFQDKLEEAGAAPLLYPLGTIRYETDINGLMAKWMYCCAVADITKYMAVTLDPSTANGLGVKPAAAAGQRVLGFAQIAVTYATKPYFWLQVGGHSYGTVKTGVSVGDPLTGTTTSGAAGQATETGSGAYKNAIWNAFTANSSGSDATIEVFAPI